MAMRRQYTLLIFAAIIGALLFGFQNCGSGFSSLQNSDGVTLASNDAGGSSIIEVVPNGPKITISSIPAVSAPTNSTEITFTFVVTPGTNSVSSVKCQLDGAAPVDCASPAGYTGLNQGQHQFQLVVTDAAGLVGKATLIWTIAVPAPSPTPYVFRNQWAS